MGIRDQYQRFGLVIRPWEITGSLLSLLVPMDDNNHEELYANMTENKLTVTDRKMSKEAGGIRYAWRAYGKPENHQKTMSALATTQA